MQSIYFDFDRDDFDSSFFEKSTRSFRLRTLFIFSVLKFHVSARISTQFRSDRANKIARKVGRGSSYSVYSLNISNRTV